MLRAEKARGANPNELARLQRSSQAAVAFARAVYGEKVKH